MRESEFTPGPWTASEPQEQFGGDQFIYGADRVAVARVQIMRHCSDEERRATAALIAAAPELYHALRAFEERGYTQAVGDIIKRALAKAHGPRPPQTLSNVEEDNG